MVTSLGRLAVYLLCRELVSLDRFGLIRRVLVTLDRCWSH